MAVSRLWLSAGAAPRRDACAFPTITLATLPSSPSFATHIAASSASLLSHDRCASATASTTASTSASASATASASAFAFAPNLTSAAAATAAAAASAAAAAVSSSFSSAAAAASTTGGSSGSRSTSSARRLAVRLSSRRMKVCMKIADLMFRSSSTISAASDAKILSSSLELRRRRRALPAAVLADAIADIFGAAASSRTSLSLIDRPASSSARLLSSSASASAAKRAASSASLLAASSASSASLLACSSASNLAASSASNRAASSANSLASSSAFSLAASLTSSAKSLALSAASLLAAASGLSAPRALSRIAERRGESERLSPMPSSSSSLQSSPSRSISCSQRHASLSPLLGLAGSNSPAGGAGGRADCWS